MGPKKKKKKPKKKSKEPEIRCDDVTGEKFYTQTDDVGGYSLWEIFCFPYIMCAKLWDCCMSLCAGANQCLVCLMCIQYCLCKIKRLTTPDPIIFPYYYYMYCQVIFLTLIFLFFWYMFGKTLVLPFIKAFYEVWVPPTSLDIKKNNTIRMSFRKYCFKKGEIFNSPIKANSSPSTIGPGVITFLIEVFVNQVFK
uniref:Uncharacterized protein n=1 Tax=Heliothis virescens TaxID=7102 RepID=A0A2A4JA99_HELVI